MLLIQTILTIIGMVTGVVLMGISLYGGQHINTFLTEGERKAAHLTLIGIGLIGAAYFTLSAISFYENVL